MLNVSIARRYARALLEVAAETGTLDVVAQQLDAVAAAMKQSPELSDVLLNPAYSRAQREGVVAHLVKGVTPALANTMRLLVERNRLQSLPDIARLFRDMADVRSGRVRGKVTSAVPLAADTVKKLEQSLEKLTQRNVVLDTQVDPSLLGGVSAQVGSVLYDGSLKRQLEELRRELSGR